MSDLGKPGEVLPNISLWRKATDSMATFLAAAAVLLVLLPLGAIFAYLLYKGFGSLNWAFLTQTPKPVGEPGGGMANAIAGSVLILAIASIVGVPIGIGAGIYLAEYGRNRFGNVVRFTADVLNGVPSIVVGIVAYGIVVLGQGHFSALAGGVALAIMMIPTITRTTEEMLLLVPQAIREAAYGLGVPRWRPHSRLRCGPRLPESSLELCWHSHASPEKPRRFFLPLSGINIGIGRSISRRLLSRCRFIRTRFRPSTSGTARLGQAR